MLVHFSIVPIGSGSSVGGKVAEVVRIIDESGMPYKINPMGTVVEGEWDEVVSLIKKCHHYALKDEDRVITTIAIDDRKGKSRRIDEKVKSVERRLGKKLHR